MNYIIDSVKPNKKQENSVKIKYKEQWGEGLYHLKILLAINEG